MSPTQACRCVVVAHPRTTSTELASIARQGCEYCGRPLLDLPLARVAALAPSAVYVARNDSGARSETCDTRADASVGHRTVQDPVEQNGRRLSPEKAEPAQ